MNSLNKRKRLLTLLFCFAMACQNNAAFAQPDTNAQKPADKAESSKSEKPDESRYSAEGVKHYNRAVEFHQSGALDQAIAEYKAALTGDDQMAEAWSNLSSIYVAQNSYRDAIESLQRAITLDEKYQGQGSSALCNDLTNLAKSYCGLGNYQEAESLYKRALALDIKKYREVFLPRAMDGYAELLRKTSRPTEAAQLEAQAEAVRAGQK